MISHKSPKKKDFTFHIKKSKLKTCLWQITFEWGIFVIYVRFYTNFFCHTFRYLWILLKSYEIVFYWERNSINILILIWYLICNNWVFCTSFKINFYRWLSFFNVPYHIPCIWYYGLIIVTMLIQMFLLISILIAVLILILISIRTLIQNIIFKISVKFDIHVINFDIHIYFCIYVNVDGDNNFDYWIPSFS